MTEFNRIFITVGTTQFNELIRTILSDDTLQQFTKLHCKNLVIQYGTGDEIPQSVIDSALQNHGIRIDCYRLKAQILDDIRDSDLVISHAGAGSCIEVLNAGKPLVVVVNDRLMDNHQTELAEQLYKDGYLLFCTPNSLLETINDLDKQVETLRPYERGNTNKFVNHLNALMGFQ